MRLLFWLLVILVILVKFPRLLHAGQDCMDNSYHLKQAYDNKNYHYVSCTCPCTQYQNFSDRGQCFKCKHYHIPRNWMVVRGDKIVMRTEQTKEAWPQEQIEVSPTTRAVIKKMIANYKNN